MHLHGLGADAVLGDGDRRRRTEPDADADYSNNTNAGTATASYTYAGDANHTGSSDSKNFTIDRADPDCSVTGYDVTYNANPHTASGSCKGVGGGELSGLDLSGTTHTDAGDYPNDPWSFAQTTNYNAASDTVHDHIDRADPDCSVTGYDVTYNANPHTASGSCKGVGGGELSGLDLSGTTHTDAGDYPNDPWSFAQTTNYNAASDTVHDHIDRADPDCSVTGYDVTYNANPHTASGSCKGVGGGELSGLDLSGTTHTDAGDYPNDPWSFAQTTNYNAASDTVHDHIDRADPDCSVTGYDVTYNANPHTASGSCKGVGGGELSGLDLSGTTHTDAGDYPNDPWSFAQTTNYNAASDTVHDHIDRADPDCSVTGYDVTYNANPHTASGSCKGVGGGELSGLDLSGTTHTDAGDYPNDPWSFAQTTNYNAASDTVHDHIDRADPDCSVTGYDVTYNANPHTASGSCKGVGGGELSGLDLSGTTHTDAGDYPNDPWSFAQTTNYNAASDTVHDHIDRADLDISAVTDSKPYDGNRDSSATPSVSGLQGTDTVSGKQQKFQSKNVLGPNGSTLEVTAYTVNDGNSGGNYSVHPAHGHGHDHRRSPLNISAVTDTQALRRHTASSGDPDACSGDSRARRHGERRSAGVPVQERARSRTAQHARGDRRTRSTTATPAATTACTRTRPTGTITKVDLDISAVTDSKPYDGNRDSSATPTRDRAPGHGTR